jgi:N-methylhydantoinase A
MAYKVGIDVGGTFTDFIVTRDGAEPRIHKTLSTPADPSIAVVEGLAEIAAALGQAPAEFAGAIDAIVHGTTVTTNATLTSTGAKSGLITTRGVRDALEMRRGIREEQYNNRYTNVPPLVPRYLRAGVGGRLDRDGCELDRWRSTRCSSDRSLQARGRRGGVDLLRERVRKPAHERAAASWCAANCRTPTSRSRPTCCRRSASTSASARPRSTRMWDPSSIATSTSSLRG